MTAGKKSSARDDAARIEDELIQSILDASTHELHELVDAMSLDFEQLAADLDTSIQQAIRSCGQEKLRRARAEFNTWNTYHKGPLFRPVTSRQAIVGQVRMPARGLPLTLAARKEKGLSASDEDALDDDLAEAERLEREAENDDTDNAR